MKHILSLYLYLFLFCVFSYSQNYQIKKIVVDATTKLPLENVLVFNETDNSTTNADGKFVFVSQKNEINLNLLGYEEVKTTFDELKNANDTIFMQIKTIELQEVVVNNAGSYMQKVYSKIKDNVLLNYTVDFFLRNTLKKENENIVLQDIYAKKNQNTTNKKMISIEILNMRKIKLFEKKDHINFKFPDFNSFISMIVPEPSKCNYTEIAFNDADYKKITFETKEKDHTGQIWSGYFIINRNDYAVVEYYIIPNNDLNKTPYQKGLISNVQFRTIKWNKCMKFSKDIATNKYYPINLKMECRVEIVTDKKTFFYDNNIDYFVTNNPTNEKVNSNFSPDKDLFKAKFPYSKDFWKNQNQLPLTTELELFLKSIADKKDKTKEYEVIGNF
ncbi:carboxypeptidase-like regulatory domain-containing protein [Flavobacterium undicola]|uniref:carboxypeptidase-like regulatory domain-containing protein n=1 Tax=Flavobacterium undicola TaxID=1932779 RepID=UPI001376FA29|nr:carboxypeptidase-like regulatory domain-containing protein [Flavobacterium undicola]MBA0884768.1 hypothetical protein [Flavobacterium undicola]